MYYSFWENSFDYEISIVLILKLPLLNSMNPLIKLRHEIDTSTGMVLVLALAVWHTVGMSHILLV